jgi:hypothetical protein
MDISLLLDVLFGTNRQLDQMYPQPSMRQENLAALRLPTDLTGDHLRINNDAIPERIHGHGRNCYGCERLEMKNFSPEAG